jgi:hypothetical protein
MPPERARRRIYSDIGYHAHHWQSAASYVFHFCRVRVPLPEISADPIAVEQLDEFGDDAPPTA